MMCYQSIKNDWYKKIKETKPHYAKKKKNA